MKQIPNKYCVILINVVLAMATFIAYEQVRHNEFVNYDDGVYVTDNRDINRGISGESVRWAFTEPHQHMWYPLTSLSHMLDCELFALEPAGHHLSNLLFHIANTLLLFAILKKMTGGIWPSAFVAAVFALHPLNVESVAWIAERKNVLSGFFWLLTIAAYIRYAKRPRIGRYLLVVLVFSLAIMAKPMVVTLPFALLLLDYWPLDRFRWQVPSISRLVLEKIPLLLLSAALCVITFLAQRGGGAVVESFSLKIRIANAIISYTRYIGKMTWPWRLAIYYPHPGEAGAKLSMPLVAAAAVLLIIISVCIIRFCRNRKYLLTGWLWFLGTLVLKQA